MAGKQGSHRMGFVEAPEGVRPNSDLVSAEAFTLRHDRGGVVTLLVEENDDLEALKDSGKYTGLEFAITTGPGPVPRMDGENIVFGRVEDGMDVIYAMEEVPAFRPNDSVLAFNRLASQLGDERAAKSRKSWGKPLRALVITACGIVGEDAAAAGAPSARSGASTA